MKTPHFETEEEAAKFWDTHSTAEYLDEWEVVESVWDPGEDTCPHCGSEMQLIPMEVELSGKLKLHHLDEYVCPTCHTRKLSTHSLEEVRELDVRIKRYGLAGLILQNLPQPEPTST